MFNNLTWRIFKYNMDELSNLYCCTCSYKMFSRKLC